MPPVSADPSTISITTTHSRSGDDKIAQLAGEMTRLPLKGTVSGSVIPAANNSKKPRITLRITRMFSRTDQKHIDNATANCDRDATTDTKVEIQGARIPKPSGEERTSSPEPKEKKNGILRQKEVPSRAIHGYKRFEQFEDGTHGHYLKPAKRQERYSDMLRDMLGGKKDRGDDALRLSLMSNWVDQLRSKRDSLVTEKKGIHNATANLVEKYGNCQEIVGRGAFGIVRVSRKRDPQNAHHELLYAVKEFRRRPQETAGKYQKRLISEFRVASSLHHRNVIHTLDLLQDAKGDYCEVMEYCAGGDLHTLVLAAGTLQVAEADCFFKQLMRGVEYLHEMGVAHRDLKLENLLLTAHGVLKITDFGNGECFRMAWETEAHMTTGACGSAPYIAPEEYSKGEFDPRAVDVWACGIIYMAMRTGRHLWRVAIKDEDEPYARYLEGRRDEDGYAPIESLRLARCRNVIYSILDPKPGRRITASQVLKSEWGRAIKVCKAGEKD